MPVNYRQLFAVQAKNKKRLLDVNPHLNNDPGIYFLTREDENGIRHAYVGLAHRVLDRLCQHLSTYQYIDNSIRRHGFFSEDNPYGYKVNFINCDVKDLEEKERYYITLYAKNGYQMKNKDTGGGSGKQELGEWKPSKGYRQGVDAGYRKASKEISHLFDLHLDVKTKSDKPNKNQEKALRKFNDFLEYHKGGES